MVGDILRAEREKRGLTIQDIEKGTSIRSLYIQSIEENQYDVIPGEVYLKGFIKTYANYLKLDGVQLVQTYMQEKIVSSDKITPDELENPKDILKTTVKEVTNNMSTTIPAVDRRRNNLQIKLVVGLAALVVTGGIYWGMNTEEKPAIQESTPAATVPQQSISPTQSKPVEKPAAPVAPVAVSLKFIGDCWTTISVDNKHVYEGIPQAGQILSWSGQQNIMVKLGNAGAVEITYNGKDLGKIGSDGDVIEKNFTKDTAAKTQ